MDPDKIKELIELISKSNFEKFELEEGDFKLRLVKQRSGKPEVQVRTVNADAAGAAPAPEAGPAPTADAPAAAPSDPSLIDIPSPIVGTFYASPNPESPPFVKPGTRVSKGQVLCIVEAMKVMNEIESEHDGEIVEVLVSNGQPVEFGEPVFRLRPA